MRNGNFVDELKAKEARIIVGTIIRANRICQQDATISRLLNKELLFHGVSHAKSLIKLACSPITGYFGPYQVSALCTILCLERVLA